MRGKDFSKVPGVRKWENKGLRSSRCIPDPVFFNYFMQLNRVEKSSLKVSSLMALFCFSFPVISALFFVHSRHFITERRGREYCIVLMENQSKLGFKHWICFGQITSSLGTSSVNHGHWARWFSKSL